jgi:hypothetical protein
MAEETVQNVGSSALWTLLANSPLRRLQEAKGGYAAPKTLLEEDRFRLTRSGGGNSLFVGQIRAF